MSAAGRRFRVAFGAAAAIVWSSAPALADMTKDQCVDANGKGQDLRRQGKLTEAADQFRKCADPTCPGMVRDDCTRRLDDAQRAQPTVAFQVKNAAGADVTDVTVTMDEKPLASHLDGTALPADAGQHVFTFTVSGQAPVTVTLVLTEGEKGRLERVVVGGGSPGPTPLSGGTAGGVLDPSSVPPPSGGGLGTQKTLGLALGGVGVAGVIVGAVFGMMAISKKSAQTNACSSATSCTDRQAALDAHSSSQTDGTIATIGFIAGGALVAGGAVLFFTGHAPERTSTARIRVLPTVGPRGAGLSLGGAF
jgi:hypothetical protein